MNRKNLNTIQIPTVALAAAAAASFLLSGTSAQAQTAGGTAARTGQMNRNGSTLPQSGGVNGTASNSTSGTASSFRVSAASIPGAVEPIMNRAAGLLRVAESRQNSAPGGAKESYRAAAQALRQLLRSNRLAAGAGTGLLSAPSVSSTQAADDIRTLRASAKSARGSQMAMLNQAASLYATGAKEYFTGQLREALFDSNVTAAPVVIRGSRSAASQAGQSGTRPRRPTSTQQGGVTVNPPSVYNQPNNGNGGVGNPGPTFGDPLTVPGTTVIAPGGGVVGPGVVSPGVVAPGVVVPPVIVSPTVPAPVQPVAPTTPVPSNP